MEQEKKKKKKKKNSMNLKDKTTLYINKVIDLNLVISHF